MAFVSILLTVFGAGALFAVGFRQLTDTLVQLSNNRIRKMMQGSSAFPPAAFLAGFGSGLLTGAGTSAIFSLLSLVDSGRTAPQRAALILSGISCSMLLPVWFLFSVGYLSPFDTLGLMLLTVALFVRFSSRNPMRTANGILTGLGLALLGISLLNGFLLLIPYSRSVASAVAAMASLSVSPGIAFLAGLFLMLLYRSPMTVFVVSASLAYRGWLPFPFCWAILLGAHAGYPVIGFLTSRSFSLNARKTAFIHLLFNNAGWIIAAAAGYALRPDSIPIHRTPFYLALFFSLLSVSTLAAGIAFRIPAVRLSQRIIPKPATGLESRGMPRLVPDYYPDSLDANILILRGGLAKMAILDHEMLMIILNASQETVISTQTAASIEQHASAVGSLSDLVIDGLTRLVEQPCSAVQAETIARQQLVAKELAKISDSCSKIMILLSRSYQKQYRFHKEGQDELFDFTAQVLDFLKYNIDFLQSRLESPEWSVARSMEEGIDSARNRLKKQARRYLEKSPEVNVRGELAFIDVIGHLEHVGDSCLAISQAIFSSCS